MNYLKTENMIYIPSELVNIIADYHDYDKYCKPQHREKLKFVIDDIKSMSEIMSIISPNLAYQCWGLGSNLIGEPENFNDEEMWGDEEWFTLIPNVLDLND